MSLICGLLKPKGIAQEYFSSGVLNILIWSKHLLTSVFGSPRFHEANFVYRLITSMFTYLCSRRQTWICLIYILLHSQHDAFVYASEGRNRRPHIMYFAHRAAMQLYSTSCSIQENLLQQLTHSHTFPLSNRNTNNKHWRKIVAPVGNAMKNVNLEFGKR